jgi:hypothetical protein
VKPFLSAGVRGKPSATGVQGICARAEAAETANRSSAERIERGSANIPKA